MMASPMRVSSQTPALSVRELQVTYKGHEHPTVRNISFDVACGEMILVSGKSGSGKSTVAMAIAGLIPGTVEGEVEGTLTLHHDFTLPGKIGYVFQDPDAQFCMQQVDDEIAFGLENIQISREAMHERITQALESAGLECDSHARHGIFSGGMKQKLAIASALALDANFFIFDEPTANLDPLATRQVFETILRLRQMGKTILVIEHKYEPILPYVDRVIEIEDGGSGCHISNARDWQLQLMSDFRAVHHHTRSGLNTVNAHTMNAVMEVKDATLLYGKKRVWRDMSFSLYPGEWVAILGPNGAGKSSLLEVLSGLTTPSTGMVKLDGRKISDVGRNLRYQQIAYGFQNPEYQFLFERVRDEIAGRIIDLDESLPRDLHEQLARYGLADVADISPYQLSQGQKRRLAVAVMMQAQHQIYLFDEPTYGQDKTSEAVILSQLSQLRDLGKTIVTVTHDVSLVRRFADRVLVVADGSLLYNGSVDGLFADEEVLSQAHILDDIRPMVADGEGGGRNTSRVSGEGREAQRVESAYDLEPVKARVIEEKSWLAQVHPGVKLFTLLVISTFTMFVGDFATLTRMWIVALVIVFGLGWCRPYPLMKRMWIILLCYVIYLWTFSANAAVPSGYHAIHWLWFQISVYGFWQGVLVSLRTFATVLYAYVFLVTTDGTDFLVSLSQSFRLTPKLSYAIMAGTSFIPRFESDLRTFRQARWIRGRAGMWILRPVTYALPLLSGAIRHSERMAIAMEARGFRGEVAEKWNGRSYYRQTPIRTRDILFIASFMAVTIGLFFW